MRLLDLFSGIGGFSLAASWVWGEDLEIACFCEKDEFCRRVLKKHWPQVETVEDVYDLERIVAYANSEPGERTRSQLEGWGGLVETNQGIQKSQRLSGTSRKIDLLTAGFPCQPASCAGKRKGTSDDRWLWPPLLAAIQATRPRWLLLENVPGLLSLESGVVFERCCSDLEAQGYEVQPLLVPACGVNAPHRRERVWIVAKSNAVRCGWGQDYQGKQEAGGNGVEGAIALYSRRHGIGSGFCQDEPGRIGRGRLGNADCHAENPSVIGCRSWGTESAGQCGVSWVAWADCHASDSNLPRPQIREMQPANGGTKCATLERNHWDEHWYAASARLCRVDAWVSRGMDGTGKLSIEPTIQGKAAGRVHRLRALGNSIVPQVAAQIMRAIKEADQNV